jgi:hypothetical protein
VYAKVFDLPSSHLCKQVSRKESLSDFIQELNASSGGKLKNFLEADADWADLRNENAWSGLECVGDGPNE